MCHDRCSEQNMFLRFHPLNEFKYNKLLDFAVIGFAKQ